MTFHGEILNVLLEYRKKHPSFNFVARQLNRNGKLDAGYFFQGNNKYAFAGIINKSGGLKMTKSVGFIFFPLENNQLKCDFEIKYKGETNENLIAFYEKVKSLFPKMEQVEDKYFRVSIGKVDTENPVNLYQFLDEYYPKIKSIADESKVKKLIISDEKFDKILQNIKQRSRGLNYWLFQANPDKWPVVSKIKSNEKINWNVSAHRDRLKTGDEVILWITGDNPGCYALGTLTSEVIQVTDENSDNQYEVEVTIEKKLSENPVLWEDIKELPEFENFKAGNQGTNFSATKEEFETILEMTEESKTGEYWELKKLFPEEKVEKYLSVLRNFIIKHQLDPRDERVSFNIRPKKKRLVFLIGNRYALAIDIRKGRVAYSVVHPETFSENHGKFTNHKGETEVYWNEVYTLEGIEDKIEEGLMVELNRNYKSPYRKSSNEEFIADVMQTETKKDPTHMKLNTSLNTILYGPPGTGKTYYSKELAVRLANPHFSVEDLPVYEGREKINKEYHRLYEVGQIIFTTFHQSFSYEDFVEGIKPVTPEKEGAPITYEVQNGVFKSLCLKAKTPNQKNFENSYADLVKDLALDQEVKKIKTPTGKIFGISLNSLSNLNLHTGDQMKKQGSLTKENILREINQEEDYPYWKGYFQGVINHLKEDYNFREKEEGNVKNYVLIIDEINRGNVSAIFGELITLLEADKRKGKSEEISVELPYSKKPFTVPSNLFIIGTMNTADRSVEALDTALRRRFTFEEVMPLPQLLKGINFKGFNLMEVLETINSRIEVLLDRDHTIGHSYFIKIISGDKTTLQEAFENRIIPLLQEYFYHDYEKIALILGEGFVERNEGKVKFANFQQIEDPEILPSFELKKEITDIEAAIRSLLNQKDEEAT
ncbi:MAG: AAA family ATPase [Bacteroidota bacterium]